MMHLVVFIIKLLEEIQELWGDIINCPNCGTDNNDEVNFCKECGFEINPNDTIRCSNCGNENEKNINFCIECGSPLNGAVVSETGDFKKSQKKSSSNFKDTLGIFYQEHKVVSILILCCIGLIIIGSIVSILTPDVNTVTTDTNYEDSLSDGVDDKSKQRSGASEMTNYVLDVYDDDSNNELSLREYANFTFDALSSGSLDLNDDRVQQGALNLFNRFDYDGDDSLNIKELNDLWEYVDN